MVLRKESNRIDKITRNAEMCGFEDRITYWFLQIRDEVPPRSISTTIRVLEDPVVAIAKRAGVPDGYSKAIIWISQMLAG